MECIAVKNGLCLVGSFEETHTVMFDDRSEDFSDGPGGAIYNTRFLERVANWCIDKVKAGQVLFENDVLEVLGLPKNQSGQILGWHPNGSLSECRPFTFIRSLVKDGEPIELTFLFDGPVLQYLPKE